MSGSEKHQAQVQAAARGFVDVSSYVRHLIDQDRGRIAREREAR